MGTVINTNPAADLRILAGTGATIKCLVCERRAAPHTAVTVGAKRGFVCETCAEAVSTKAPPC
jgi:hypothetical protein